MKKKIISLLLTLVLALSATTMTVFAASEFYTVSISSGGNYNIPEGAYSATSEDTIKIENYSTNDITVFVEYWSDTFPLKYFYMGGDSSFVLPAFPAGKHVSNITTTADSITFTLADDPTTPDWFDDVAAKVDAAYDKLVADINGTEQTFASTHPGYTFAELIGTLDNVSYSQDGNVYAISGQGSMIFGVFVITLDADGNVVSVADKGYNGTYELYNHVYAIPQTNNQAPAPAPAPEKKEETKKDDAKKSPATGATTLGLGSLGLGVAILTALKKRD